MNSTAKYRYLHEAFDEVCGFCRDRVMAREMKVVPATLHARRLVLDRVPLYSLDRDTLRDHFDGLCPRHYHHWIEEEEGCRAQRHVGQKPRSKRSEVVSRKSSKRALPRSVGPATLFSNWEWTDGQIVG